MSGSYACGGGRTFKANTMRRYLAGMGSSRTVESATKTGLGPLAVVVAAGVRATTQTGHVRDSALFAWWCATTATADHKVSTRHRNAAILATERIPHSRLRQ